MAVDGADRRHERLFALETTDEVPLAVELDKQSYRAGETARIRVFAGADVARASVDIYRGAQGIQSTTVDLEAGVAEIDLPVTDALSGVIVVDALALREGDSALRASRPLFVEGNDRLEVDVTTDGDTYLPGGAATLTLSVRDASGAPRVASVGLNVVDDAVFAVGGEPTTSIRQLAGVDSAVLPDSLRVGGGPRPGC